MSGKENRNAQEYKNFTILPQAQAKETCERTPLAKCSVLKRGILMLVCTGLFMFVLAACGSAQDEEVGVLRMAILVDDGNREQENAFEDFREALGAHIGMEVKLVPGVVHLVAIEAMRAGELDLMWGSPFIYLLAQQTMDVERLVVTDSPNAINRAVFVTGQDDILTLEDLPGRNFAFTTASSASGFLYPMYYFINQYGLGRDEILTDGVLFNEVRFAGGNNPAIVGAAHGDFDAIAVGNLQFNRAIEAGVIDANAVRVIGYTPNIPFPGYIASQALPQELRQSITEFLLSWDSDEYSIARWEDAMVRYALPDPSEIEHLRSMTQVLDIDLEEQG